MTQQAPQLTMPTLASSQNITLTDLAAIALPIASGRDVVGNAFANSLASASASGHDHDKAAGFMMDDAQIDVLLLMSAAWQKAQIADRKLESEMTTLATDAATNQAQSQIAAGEDAFASAVGASALNVGMQVTGAVTRVRALNKEHASLKINTQNAQDAHARENMINRAVRSTEAVRASDINTVTVGSGAQTRTLRLEEDMLRAPAAHAATMSEGAMLSASRSTDLSTRHALNQRAWGREYAKADLWRMGGDVSAKMVDGVGQMEQSNEHGHQTIEQNQQEVSRSDASLHEESARQNRAIAQEMHNITNQLISNIGSVAAQVAGNIRV
ncbi:IpaC/SipC family type III secretion system effector [Robbsia andropogonis]|uniref:IpaC/SipC family type III secretion system effector n=1 Tax=Robbsia andropogonis TaxID=28092 RepID=UPI003D1D87EE